MTLATLIAAQYLWSAELDVLLGTVMGNPPKAENAARKSTKQSQKVLGS